MVGAIAVGLAVLALMARAQENAGVGVDQATAEESDQLAQVVVVSPLPAPRTRLEAMLRRKETVIQRASKQIAVVPAENGATLKVTAIELTDAKKNDRAYGLAIAVQPSGDRSASVSYVDADEIDSLTSGMDSVVRAGRNGTVLTDYGASYCSRGDLTVTNYERNGGRMIALRSVQTLLPGGQVQWLTAHLQLGMANELRRQVIAAKAVLDEVKTGK
jgi:hypothetical protein